MTSTLDDRSPVAPTTPATAVTPRLELSVTRALEGYDALASTLPGTAVHYAVKANPHPVLLRALAQAGSRFDVASQAETDAVPDRRRGARGPRLLQPGQAPARTSSRRLAPGSGSSSSTRPRRHGRWPRRPRVPACSAGW